VDNFTCFLIDDDVDDQEIFCTVIDTIAPTWKCITAVNGQSALAMLKSMKILPDIIFLDLNMPLMNGRQFLHEVNRQKIIDGVPIIVLTTSADYSTKVATLELGAKQFITKPDKFSDWETVLKQAIKTCL
jgi:DNA-binding response OmpR family regulator